jgi:polyphosphate kinase
LDASRTSGFQDEGIFAAIQGGDVLVHHPYESFDASVEAFIYTAADDPQTISIKMTAYRIGDDTLFAKSLVRAAEQEKQVACVIETKACSTKSEIGIVNLRKCEKVTW